MPPFRSMMPTSFCLDKLFRDGHWTPGDGLSPSRFTWMTWHARFKLREQDTLPQCLWAQPQPMRELLTTVLQAGVVGDGVGVSGHPTGEGMPAGVEGALKGLRGDNGTAAAEKSRAFAEEAASVPLRSLWATWLKMTGLSMVIFIGSLAPRGPKKDS
mmetsp:Transcript_72854/g.126462  ORF Transcript_72854/g.126462 Transcript_72854/m.126462 type:complete len:157 (-) Transcript_72854:299-769(-)